MAAGGGAQALALHEWLGAACGAGYMTAVLGDGPTDLTRDQLAGEPLPQPGPDPERLGRDERPRRQAVQQRPSLVRQQPFQALRRPGHPLPPG